MKTCPQCRMRYPNEASLCFVDGTTLVEAHDPRIGTIIAGRYVIEDLLGEGGMAVVYRARHKLIDRPCAIKIMNPQLARDKIVRERFRREAKSAQQLAHPNIIEIYDQGDTEDGTAYIVMELLLGSSLADVIAQGPMDLGRAIGVMIQMSRGIARAHDLGVIHRDLKPENTFLCFRDDGSDLVKLLDFGIARSRSDSRLTGAGELFGTPQYMAPERVTSGDAGPNVDLYALGVLFFEIVTGRLPFDAPDIPTYLIKHLKEPAPPARQFRPDLPEKVDRLIAQLLAKDPKARPVDAHKVEQDLFVIAYEIGAPIPPDPESDPASSRSPAKTLPSIGIHRWAQRTYVFEQMLARAYGTAPPPDMKRMLAELAQLVQRVTELRASSVSEQRKLEQIDARGRDGRQRFGFAVDALGLDASRAKGEAREAHAALDRASAQTAVVRESFAKQQREILTWEGRSGMLEPYTQLSDAYRIAATIVDEWLTSRDEEKRAQGNVAERERTASDLDYQIRELRGALTNHEQAIESDRAATEKKIIQLSGEAETLETKLLTLATAFCAPLRRLPELAPLFVQLESDVV